MMVWKQDLAKLKAALGEAGGPPVPVPKPKPKPVEAKELVDEDGLFLAAMGVRSAPKPKPVVASPAPAALPAPVPAPEPQGFEAAMGDLKGIKPLAAHPVLEAPKPAPAKAPEPAPAPRPEAKVDVAPPAPEPAPVPEPLPAELPAPPTRIQLAAGMAVEVDGSLDLRHHSVADAMERLKDRLADGVFLGWRTLHVQLGGDPELHAALSKLLEEGGAPMVARYAQAPVPMGGAQAWILYY